MAYKVVWHEKAVKELELIGKPGSELIIDKVTKYLVNDPVGLGKLLKGKLKLFRRYRVGKFRIIYIIDEVKETIVILKVGKRDKVYKNKK